MDALQLISAQRFELAEALANLAAQHCPRNPITRKTTNGRSLENAEALRLLAAHGRFRVLRDADGEVAGYWPGDDPQKQNA
jgi:hypothetical protein